jgi:hypothetical protein
MPGQSQTSLIIGQWTLQQEKYVQYVDAVKTQDVILNASSNNIATVQFNKDGTFASASVYSSDPTTSGLGSLPANVSAATTGTYGFADNLFHMSPYVTGLASGDAGFYGFITTSSIPAYSPVSNTVKINQLTASDLNMHIEVVYTLTSDNVVQTYKTVGDYYYSK